MFFFWACACFVLFFRLGRAFDVLYGTGGAGVRAFACIRWKVLAVYVMDAVRFEVVAWCLFVCGSQRVELFFELLVRRVWRKLCALRECCFSHSFLRVLVKRQRPSAFWRCFISSHVLMWMGLYMGNQTGPAKAENWCLWCRYWRNKQKRKIYC